MFIEKEYKLEKWSKWDDEVGKAIEDFIEIHSISPNGLSANHWTHSQIDFIANISAIREHTFKFNPETKAYDIPYSADEKIEVSRFGSPDWDFEVRFCYNPYLKDKEFTLFFTDEEDDDDDEVTNPINTPILIETY